MGSTYLYFEGIQDKDASWYNHRKQCQDVHHPLFYQYLSRMAAEDKVSRADNWKFWTNDQRRPSIHLWYHFKSKRTNIEAYGWDRQWKFDILRHLYFADWEHVADIDGESRRVSFPEKSVEVSALQSYCLILGTTFNLVKTWQEERHYPPLWVHLSLKESRFEALHAPVVQEKVYIFWWLWQRRSQHQLLSSFREVLNGLHGCKKHS